MEEGPPVADGHPSARGLPAPCGRKQMGNGGAPVAAAGAPPRHARNKSHCLANQLINDEGAPC
jgi:hypothetical protein